MERKVRDPRRRKGAEGGKRVPGGYVRIYYYRGLTTAGRILKGCVFFMFLIITFYICKSELLMN
ncbi:hypothetical protein RCO48_35665 [Peribacillus frigoritolerans]|nr:hypothetical protein [Peribacillus frigoritolerans]